MRRVWGQTLTYNNAMLFGKSHYCWLVMCTVAIKQQQKRASGNSINYTPWRLRNLFHHPLVMHSFFTTSFSFATDSAISSTSLLDHTLHLHSSLEMFQVQSLLQCLGKYQMKLDWKRDVYNTNPWQSEVHSNFSTGSIYPLPNY